MFLSNVIFLYVFLIYEVSSSFKSYIYLFFGNEMRRYFTSLDLFPYVYFYFLDSEKLRRRCFVVSPIVFPYMNLFVFFFFLFRKILGEKKMSRCLLSFFFSLLFFVCEYFSFFSQNRMQRLFMSMHRLLFYYLIQEKLRRRCFVVSPIVFPICEYFLFFFSFFFFL